MRTRKMMLYAGMIASLTMGIFISGAGQQKVEAKTKVTYTLKKGTLTIKGKGAMPAKMKFRRNKKIKKVIIKKGVTSVSYEAFALCKNLNSVTIPSTVKTIGIRSFEFLSFLLLMELSQNLNSYIMQTLHMKQMSRLF